MKNLKKKGFTIVELVIVIAVIAVLAAVLIPTFVNLTRKANVSADTVLVKNLNTSLSSDAKEHKTMHDALEAAKANGYDIAKIQTKANGNKILWDSKNDCFVYLDSDKDKIVYIPDTKSVDVEDKDLWVISNEVSDIYSTYLYGYEDTEVNAKLGLDTGDSSIERVVLNTDAAGELTIRTNGGVLELNAANATINHYGLASEVYVKNVADSTYNLYGIAAYVEVSSGEHVVLKQGSSVTAVYAPGNNVEVENGQNEIVHTSGNKDEIFAAATKFAGGLGTKENPYLIAKPEQVMNISEIKNQEAYFALANNLDMSNVNVENGNAYIVINDLSQYISLNLNGYKMSNVYYQLFSTICKVEIFNGTIDFYSSVVEPRSLSLVNTLSYNSEVNAKFYDLNINGSICTNSAHFGPVVMYAYSLDTYESNIYVENVVSNVDINNQYTSAYSGGLLGYVGGKKASLTVKNCEYNGTLSSPYAAGFAGGCTSPKTSIIVEGNKLTGTIIGTNEAIAFGGNGNMIGGKEKAAEINNSVVNSGIVVKATNDPTLFQETDNLNLGEEFVINHNNAAVSYYKVSYMFWVSYKADIEAGRNTGYPRSIEFEIKVNDKNSYNTGIYKNKVAQSETDRSTDANRVASSNGCVVWQEGDTYFIYSTDFTLVDTMNSTVYVYGYNSANTPVVFAQYAFNLNK